MRAVFGMLSLVVVLAGVGLLVKKQLTANRQAVPVLALPASPGAPMPAMVDPNATVKVQSQQIQQQYKQALESAMQQARPGDDAEKP